MGLLNVTNLGQFGVNVDKGPLALDDNELTKSQNAVQNKAGVAGGLVNRPGLTKYDSDAGAGSNLGALGVALGPGPGGTTDNKVYYLGMEASPYWRTSSDSFATTATTTKLARMGTIDTRASTMLNGRLYYIARDIADNRVLRVFDGTQDKLFFATQGSYTVRLIQAVRGALYVGLSDGTTSYLYKLDSAGRATQVGAALPTDVFGETYDWLKTVAAHHGNLFVAGTVSGSPGNVYRISELFHTTTLAWTTDYTHPVNDGEVLSLASYKGLLYAGVSGQGGTLGAVYVRSAAGVYSVSDNYNNASGNPQHLIEFKGNLYAWATRYQGGVDRIRKFDNSSWSTVHSMATSDHLMNFYNTGNKLFAIQRASTGVLAGLHTTDGSTWTSFDIAVSDFAQHGFGWFKPTS